MKIAIRNINQNKISISISKMEDLLHKSKIRYAELMDYMQDNDLQYIGSDFNIGIFLNSLFDLYPECEQYMTSKLMGKLDIFNPLVLDYNIYKMSSNKEAINILSKAKEILELHEMINVFEKYLLQKKCGKKVNDIATYSPMIIMEQNIYNRCVLGDINKPYIEKIRVNNGNKEKVTFSFNEFYYRALQKDLGIEHILKDDSEIRFIPLLLEGYLDYPLVNKRLIEYVKTNNTLLKDYKCYLLNMIQPEISKFMSRLREQGYTEYLIEDYSITMTREN